MTWNGAGGWLIFSQSRQVNFSRTVWITFHWRGITSSVSVMSSPSLASRVEPQQPQVWRASDHHALARQMGWERLARGCRRTMARTITVGACGLLGPDFVLGGGGFELLEL